MALNCRVTVGIYQFVYGMTSVLYRVVGLIITHANGDI